MPGRNTWILPCLLVFAAHARPVAQDIPTWIPAHGQTAYFQSDFLKIDQGTLYAIDQSRSSDRWLRRSDDTGGTWNPIGPPLPSQANIGAMEILGTQIFLMSWGDGVWRLSGHGDTAWVRVNDGLRNLDSLNHMALSGSTLLLAAEYGFFSWSAAEGRWIPAGEGFPGSGTGSIAVMGSTLFVTDTDEFLYRGALTATGWTWSKLPFRGGKAIVRKGRTLFAAGSSISSMKYSVFRSEDEGVTWEKKAAGLPADTQLMGGPVPLARVGENLFVSFHDEGIVYRSADDGENWAPYAGRPENRFVYIEILEAVGAELLAMSEEGLYRLSTGFSSIRPFKAVNGGREGVGKRLFGLDGRLLPRDYYRSRVTFYPKYDGFR